MLHVWAPAQDIASGVGQDHSLHRGEYPPFKGVLDRDFYVVVGVDDLDGVQISEGLETFYKGREDGGDLVIRKGDC